MMKRSISGKPEQNSSSTSLSVDSPRVPLGDSASLEHNLPIQSRQQRPVRLHALPEMSQPQIFVGAVLMIVVVHDWHTHRRQSQIFEYIHRNAPAKRRRNYHIAFGVFHHADDRLRYRQIHSRPRSAIAALLNDFGNFWMRASFLDRWLAVYYANSLLSNKLHDLPRLLLRTFAFD